MLRFGSLLLIGLLALTGCDNDKSAQADREFRKACKLWNSSDVNQYDAYDTRLANQMIKAAKLDSKYKPYLEDLHMLQDSVEDSVRNPADARITAECELVKQ